MSSPYYKKIAKGGFSKESDDINVWGGNSENEYVPNERVNGFMQARLLRADRYDTMTQTAEQYRDNYIAKLYCGFSGFNPLNGVAVSDIVKYVIENSSMKDIIWKHLVELINCTTELSELVRTQALLHCDSLSTSGLDLEGERLDTIIADPDVLRNMMNNIVEFINCTNANNVSGEKFKSIDKFESGHELDLEKNIDASASDDIDAYKKFCINLMNEEINVCKYLRDLEKYHNYVIVESNKLFKKCNLLKKEFAKV